MWAAGDGIAYAIKHGVLAAQQANAAAVAIAALAGADADLGPFGSPMGNVALPQSGTHSGPQWWPPGGAVGEQLTAYLANHGNGTSSRSRSAWRAGCSTTPGAALG